jgi:hypothetical protein
LALTEGTKYDQKNETHPRMDLIPPQMMWELGSLYGVGALKYEDRNWEKGIKFGRVYAAAIRHLLKFWRGERMDPETGAHHLIAAIWNLTALHHFDSNDKYAEYDDRPDPAGGRTEASPGECRNMWAGICICRDTDHGNKRG